MQKKQYFLRCNYAFLIFFKSNKRYLSHSLGGVWEMLLLVWEGLWYRGRKKLFQSTWHFISFFLSLSLSYFYFLFIYLNNCQQIPMLVGWIINHCREIYIKFFRKHFSRKYMWFYSLLLNPRILNIYTTFSTFQNNISYAKYFIHRFSFCWNRFFFLFLNTKIFLLNIFYYYFFQHHLIIWN